MAAAQPLRVSPFIKFCRWSLLGSGILYGMSRHQYLSKQQTARRDEYEKTRPEREAKAKAEKDRLQAEEIASIEKEIGSTL